MGNLLEKYGSASLKKAHQRFVGKGSDTLHKRFFDAIFAGDLALVKQIIAENGGADFLNQRVDKFIVGDSFLSAINGTADIVRINENGGIQAASYISHSCGVLGVLCCIYQNKPEICDYLFSQGVPADARLDDLWNSALIHKAIAYLRPKIVELMLEKGVDPNALDGVGNNCLNKACHLGGGLLSFDPQKAQVAERIEIIELLGKRRVNANHQGQDLTPLQAVAKWGKGIILIPPAEKKRSYTSHDFEVHSNSPTLQLMDALKRIGADPKKCVMHRTSEDIYHSTLCQAKWAAAEELNKGTQTGKLMAELKTRNKTTEHSR